VKAQNIKWEQGIWQSYSLIPIITLQWVNGYKLLNIIYRKLQWYSGKTQKS